jgi:hypothetical protein
LFHAGDAHGLCAFRGFPPPVADPPHHAPASELVSRRSLSFVPSLRPVASSSRRTMTSANRSRLQGCEHPVGPFPRAGVTRLSVSRSSLGVSPSRC